MESWSTQTGRLIAKALSRLHGNELLTIKEAAQLAGVSIKVDPFVKTGGRAVLRATLLLFLSRYYLFSDVLTSFPVEYTSAGV